MAKKRNHSFISKVILRLEGQLSEVAANIAISCLLGILHLYWVIPHIGALKLIQLV
jgi:hypothetical protein